MIELFVKDSFTNCRSPRSANSVKRDETVRSCCAMFALPMEFSTVQHVYQRPESIAFGFSALLQLTGNIFGIFRCEW